MKLPLDRQEMHKGRLIIAAFFLFFFSSMIIALPAKAAIIDQTEYFFDTDPGEGLGKSLTITPGGGPDNPLRAEFSGISTSGLSVGSHLLYIRFRCNGGSIEDKCDNPNWGPARQYAINITAPVSTINTAEVFVDQDPGQGYGLPVPTPMDGKYDGRQESLQLSLNTMGWTRGGHTVYVRARNSLGVWGPARPVFSDPAPNVTVIGDKWIVRAEYFFDVDPGEGFALQLPLRSSGGIGIPAVIDLSGVPIEKLASGTHTLFIRAQDSEGLWGPTRRINLEVIQTAYTLTGAEFFVDTDPGAGNGISIPPYDGAFDEGSELVTASLNSGTLAQGSHTICVRAQDNRNQWSSIPSTPAYPMCTNFTVQTAKAVVTGYIKEEGTGLPLNGVWIYSPDDGAETYSSFDGSYSLTVQEGTRRFRIATGGYQPVEMDVNVAAPVTQRSFTLVKVEQPFGAQKNQGMFAEPVNTATGNYFFNRTDLKVPAPGLPFEFTRYYNAQDLTSSSLGFGWSHNLDVRIYQWEDMVIVKYGDGHEERYQSDVSGGYIPQPGNYTKLSFVGGAYELLTKNQNRYRFSSSSQLTSLEDRNGNRLTINRNAGGQITTVVDSAGRSYSFGYNSSGFLSSISDSIGRMIRYIVDDKGDMISNIDGNGNTTKYAYDSHHLLLTVVDSLGNSIVSNTYDAMRRIVSLQKDALGNTTTFVYDPVSRTTTIKDPMDGVTKHIYDEYLRLVDEMDPLNYSIKYTYDSNHNRTEVVNKNGNKTTYSYDAMGNVTSKIDALGSVTAITYDAQNNPLTRTDELGNTTTFEYDAKWNLAQTTDPLSCTTKITYTLIGLIETVTDCLGSVTTHRYDLQGNLKEAEYALGGITRYTYDGIGRRISSTDARGNTTSYAYDSVDNLLTITDSLGYVTKYTYDRNNNKVSVTDPLENTTQFAYDAKDRLTTMKDLLNNAIAYTYDALDRKATVKDKRGNITNYTYDAVGNLIKVTDAKNGTVSSTYDANGNRLTMTEPNGNITTYTYDALNRLIAKIEPLGGQYQYEYDAVGNMISRTDPKGNKIRYAYDALYRLTKTTYPDASTVSFIYDAKGNRTGMADSLGTSSYSYDALGRLTGYTGPSGKTVGYGYDANGNRTTLTYPDGKVVQYGYDALNRLTSVKDWLNKTTTYTYDAAGRLTGTVNPNATTAAYTYDTLGRLTGLTNVKGDTTVISSYTYTLDAVGNNTQAIQNEPLIPNIPAQNITYSYVAENRLTNAGGIANTFDANGNMTAKGSDTFVYDYNDRLIQSNIGGVTTQYSYDGLGNRLVKVEGETVTRYVLDINGSLSSVIAETDASGTITAFYVHGLGLISKVLPDSTAFYYHYDSRGSTVALTNASQNITDAYAYDSFGRVANTTGSTANPFRYVGRYGVMEEGNGLQYIRARYYAPELGRFITKDPLTGKDGDTQSLNRYVYAMNNPVRLVDVSGLSTKDTVQSKSKFILTAGYSGKSDRYSVDLFYSGSTYGESTPPVLKNQEKILAGQIETVEGIVDIAEGVALALPGITVISTGVAVCPATIAGCAAIGYGFGLSVPGLIKITNGGLKIVVGMGDISSGLTGKEYPLVNTLSTYSDYLDWGILGSGL